MKYGDYAVTVAYPERPSKPALAKSGGAAGYRQLADALEKWEADMVVYRGRTALYRQANADADARFKADVLAEYGLTGNPKAEALYRIAWENGHSSGYGEVENWVSELAELVKGA